MYAEDSATQPSAPQSRPTAQPLGRLPGRVWLLSLTQRRWPRRVPVFTLAVLIGALLFGSEGLAPTRFSQQVAAANAVFGADADSRVAASRPDSKGLDPLPGDSLSFPIRATFYYPWYPEAWNQHGYNPYTRYTPSLGAYNGGDPAVIAQHIAAMRYGNLQAGIASWWGQGHATDLRVPSLLAAAAGTGFKWGIYYERESTGDPSVDAIRADLTYLRDHYAADPSFLRINGRFVVFVYTDAADGCAMVDRWTQANTVGAYLVLKVFSGYASCPSQPDSWHQYAPASAVQAQGHYSYNISPGFWKQGEDPRLGRNLGRWRQNIRAMLASGADFQLVTSFNEWGEGTAVESAAEWANESGYGDYLDALHANGVEPAPLASAVTPAPPPTDASIPPATNTPVRSPSDTPIPPPTDTPVPPPPTDTPVPPTGTSVPPPTDTPVPGG